MKARKVVLLQALSRQFDEYTKDQLTAFIVCRNVLVDGVLATDPRFLVDPNASFSFTFDTYVSRGGYKLEHALDQFGLGVQDLIMLDAGSSTGGFTDCLLKRGAKLVHSVDVGYNQLDWRLRTNSQVMVHEKQNIMTLEALDPACDAAVCDLSFRSIAGAASHILSLCKDGWLVSLIKPQFEVPKGLANFNGVVQDCTILMQVMRKVYDLLAEDEVGIHQLAKSPITGHKGNIEFLALLKLKPGLSKSELDEHLEILVR
ncbi:TlyA family RNA methyltransferase [Sphaerochaeta globosa]|uniref:Hemolysin A n=1 Tax=Sphaerochaeta globosa (strain ATCC BAA-1886 / DSM 22777 / Buddy) TaxID=158189 RepID=F0RS24_SPHGB|nr:TlyA family RNA methyltransferase [Sphaerochaeta globosa]ADY14629.1 hemolysin A [Sphaerochaeta globosa str. Buddy]